jgi:23S rRNA (cytosine1962-C5)-methyltransferase
MLAGTRPDTKSGDIVAVYDKTGQHFGHAFYHDRSQIALRMLSWSPEAIDDRFFRERLRVAVDWRRQLLGGEDQTDACRLVHSEGDGLSGLVAERYRDCIAIEVFALGIYRRLGLIRGVFRDLTGIERFVVRADTRIERIEGFVVQPSDSVNPPASVDIREHGLRFRLDLQTGHKTGFFCDQRDNRRKLARFCSGKSVLDMCCYSGGFGIHAKVLGGAAEVTGVDLDEEAVALARKNAHLNDAKTQHVHADAFSYLRQMQQNGRTFDVVVLDPPKFVASKDDREEGSRKYVDLNTLGMSVVAPGGLLLTCSCSGMVSGDDFFRILRGAANRNGRQLQILEETGAAADHPVMANCPESKYLKAFWTRVM